jgi:membrane AbrB-like protein
LIAPMRLSRTPSKTVWLRAAETLLIAAAGGITLNWFGFPAGLVTGSLLAVAAAALLGRPVTVPAPLSRVISVLVGISLGAVVTPDTFKGLAAFPVSVAVLAVSTLCMIVATTSYLRFVHGWDAQSALFGASPGALAQVMTLAAEYKADLRAIAIVQTMREMALTIGIPAALSYFGLTAHGGLMDRFIAAGSPAPIELAVLVVSSSVVAWLFVRLRLPGGLLFGSMVASAAWHGSGLIHSILPWWLVYAAVIAIGAVSGSRFANTDVITLLRFSAAGLGSLAVAMTVAGISVLVLTTLMSAPVADSVVAFAPGAQDTMMVLALSLHLDPVFVGALQVSRFLIVSLLVPLLAHRIRRMPKEAQSAKQPGATRPEIDDDQLGS